MELNQYKKQLKEDTLMKKWECLQRHFDESGIIIVDKDIAKNCGYQSFNSFTSFVLKPLILKGYIKRIAPRVYKKLS